MRQAKRKCWLNEDGQLVDDGDPEAASLFAAEGQIVLDADLADIHNANKYFKNVELTELAIRNSPGGIRSVVAVAGVKEGEGEGDKP